MKVIKIKSGNPFRAVGVDLIEKKDGFAYGIVRDTYSNNGEEIFKGTKKRCSEFINKIV